LAEGASLTVMGGPMAGTRLVIDDAVDEILVGSDPDCRLSLDLPGVSPIHARVWRDLGGITVYDTRSPQGLYVNDERVVDQAPLHDGDVLWLGAPGDADSVMIQCRLPEDSILGAPVPDAGFSERAAPKPMAADEPPASFVADEAPPLPAFMEAPEIVTTAPDPAAPTPMVEDAASLIDMFPLDEAARAPAVFEEPPPAAPTPMAADEAPAPVAAPTPMVTTAPAFDASPAPPVEAPEDFVMDPAWGEYDTLEAPTPTAAPAPMAASPPPPDDIEFLVDEPAPDAAPPPPPAAAPTATPPPPTAAPTAMPPTPTAAAGPRAFEAPIGLGAPAPRPEVSAPPRAPAMSATAPAAPTPMVVDHAPVPPAAPRQPTGAPPKTAPPPRAIIDDTRPPAAARKSGASPRPGPTEGVMDWARGTSSPDSDAVPAAAPVRPAPRASRAPVRTGRGPLLPVAAAVVVLAALAGGYFAWTGSRTPRIDAVSPARVTAGNTLTLTGADLGETAGATSASIGGRSARVLRTTGDRLEIEVPELPMTPGRDTSVPIVVTAGGRESKPASVAVYQAPRLKSLAPDVAMPGENVVLSGTSLGAGVKVRFGDFEAQVVDASPVSLTVTVPALPGAPGTEVSVVAVGADPSNALTFVVGKVPLLTGIEPRSASPGDLVTVAGRGFNAQPVANRVTVGGVPALVVSAGPRGLEFVVPRAIAGEEGVAITVPGSTQIGQAGLSIIALAEPVGFRFVAEPFEDVPGHEHAALATGLGPAFILTSAQGKSAAERAYEAQQRFNDAAQVLRSTRTAEIRARYEPTPVVYLVTRDTVLLDVAGADAEAYNEDWTRSRTKGGPVTVARLATWWEAVARDLVLLLLRGEKPEYAQALAPEGKVLADLHDAARRTVGAGVPSALVAEARGPMREALRAVALRVPATVSAPVARPDGAVPAAAESVPPLKLDGSWRGRETESGVHKPITIVFRGGSGTLTYERALSMSVPVLLVQQPQKGAVRFEVRVGSGTRFYRGRWDGSRITGKLTSDPEGRTEIGTFELDPSR